MKKDLDQVRDLRPDVAPPSQATRRDARQRLLTAIENETTDLSQRQSADDPHAGRRRRHPWPRGIGAALAIAATLFVVVGAFTLLGHRGSSSTATQRAAVRGVIRGRGGQILVGNAKRYDVTVTRSQLPSSGTARRAYDRRLQRALGLKPTSSCPATRDHGQLGSIACRLARGPAAVVTVATGISASARRRLARDADRLPGVTVSSTAMARYPAGDAGAAVLGLVGRSVAHGPSAGSSALTGQTGLEAQYQSQLADGDTLDTSIAPALERTGQRALQRSIAANDGLGGAFVAMDPQSGAVYAMGSAPTFEPAEFSQAGGISEKQGKALTSPASDDPLLDRAIQSVAPVGSMFTPITAVAALQSGNWMVDQTFDDDADFHIGAETLQNSGGAHYGVINLKEAIKVSDDEFFYNLGAKTNVDVPKGGPIQTWARKYGIGQKTGIDLPYESKGTLPDPAWRAQRNKDEQQCEDATGAYKYSRTVDGTTQISATPKTGYHRSPKHASCGIADGLPWTVGDNVNLAVGQGDLQLSPLQLAVVYSALANNGTIVTPHIGQEITNSDGTVLQKIASHTKRKLNINPIYLSAIQTGLHEAAQGGGPLASPGTSQTVMQNFGMPVYGQVGTAQYIPTSGPRKGMESDYAWDASYVPATATHKPIVVVTWVQGAGFGSVAAAPVAREILSQWFTGKPGRYIPGDSDAQ